MATTVLLLIQFEWPHWTVLVGAGLVLLLGISYFVYILLRLRKSDRAIVEDDWRSSRTTLLGYVDEGSEKRTATEKAIEAETREVEAPPRTEPVEVQQETTGSAKPELEPEPQQQTVIIDEIAPPDVQQQTISAEVTRPSQVQQAASLSEPEPVEISPPTAPLSTAQEPEPQPESDAETSILDEEIWSELEAKEASARVDERPQRQAFVPPTVDPIVPKRKPFEPPRIQPLSPRSEAPSPPLSPGASHPPASRTAERVTESRKPAAATAGSVLGLPAESSNRPLVLGTPTASQEELTGVWTISDYTDRHEDKPKGYLGTISLAIAVLLVGGAVLAYLFVPQVQSYVDRLRERPQPQAQPAADPAQTKARVFITERAAPDRNETRVRGDVYNVSQETLEGLSAEVTLMPNDQTPSKIINVAVQPSPLPPRQPGGIQGAAFEFTYKTKEHPGYNVRLLSNGVELTTATPPRPSGLGR
jgi:hypothetical protein